VKSSLSRLLGVRTLLVTLVLLLAIGVAVLATAGEAVTRDGSASGFRQFADTDRTAYADGEPVRMTYRVCWARPWPTTTSSTGGSDVFIGFRVLDDSGEVVADTSHTVHTLELRIVTWLPGQCRSVDREWNQRYWNQAERTGGPLGVPVEGERVLPGSYRFEVWWMHADDPGWRGLPVETQPFTIEPG
jgi:hypothetical protein